MTEYVRDALSKRLKPGYRVVLYTSDDWGIANTDGRWVREDNRVITFKNKPVEIGHFFDNLVATLRRAGAIKEPRKRVHERREPVRAPKNAIVIAEETLRDTNASPRERALARNYLQLFESNQRVRKLAQTLGRRLKELENEID